MMLRFFDDLFHAHLSGMWVVMVMVIVWRCASALVQPRDRHVLDLRGMWLQGSCHWSGRAVSPNALPRSGLDFKATSDALYA
jgi:hypothetical protein